MIEFVGLRAKTYAYLMNDDNEHKKAKERKKCVKKKEYLRLMITRIVNLIIKSY